MIVHKNVIDRNIWIFDEPIFSSKLIVNLFCRRTVKQSFTLGNKNKN